jgi:hypothetical protein
MAVLVAGFSFFTVIVIVTAIVEYFDNKGNP